MRRELGRRLTAAALIATIAIACAERVDSSIAPPRFSSAPVDSLGVMFLGHSLVGHDMPSMLGTFAAARGKEYRAHVQVGWGTRLADHWEWNGSWTRAPIGFVDDNRGRLLFGGEGKQLLRDGEHDVLVLTEVNGAVMSDGDETVRYATRLARLARKNRPDTRIVLYANWLSRRDAGGDFAHWQERCERDAPWWNRVAERIDHRLGGEPVAIVPGGILMARISRAIAEGRVPGISLGDVWNDDVHLSPRGFYPIALAHFAVIYRTQVRGLPHHVQGEHGPLDPPLHQSTAAAMQIMVDEVLSDVPRSGVPRPSAGSE